MEQEAFLGHETTLVKDYWAFPWIHSLPQNPRKNVDGGYSSAEAGSLFVRVPKGCRKSCLIFILHLIEWSWMLLHSKQILPVTWHQVQRTIIWSPRLDMIFSLYCLIMETLGRASISWKHNAITFLSLAEISQKGAQNHSFQQIVHKHNIRWISQLLVFRITIKTAWRVQNVDLVNYPWARIVGKSCWCMLAWLDSHNSSPCQYNGQFHFCNIFCCQPVTPREKYFIRFYLTND